MLQMFKLMKLPGFAPILLSILTLWVASTMTAGIELQVTIYPKKHYKYKINGSLPVTIEIKNISHDLYPSYPNINPIAFYPGLDDHKNDYPDTIITYFVTDSNQKPIRPSKISYYNTNILCAIRAMPNMCNYITLYDNYYYGIQQDLIYYGFKIQKPGVYHIKVKLDFQSRKWIQKRGIDKISCQECCDVPDLKYVVDGVYESNEITIRVTK